MAKLDYYFGLCPLIDQRSLLGISEGAEEGYVIVTLGKNIAIKYKVSDQKQVHSWRTKDKFTSPVIFDRAENKYVAVFNQSYIRMWYKEDEHLDKQKKYKFNSPIYTILSCAGKSILVFNNGAVMPLNVAIEQRKTLELDGIITKADEYIFDVFHTNVNDVIFVGIIAGDQHEQYFTWVCSNDNTFSHCNPKVILQRSNLELISYMFNKAANLKDVALYTLWSDTKFYSMNLNEESNFPGHLCAVIVSLSCEELVTAVALDGDYIAMYGADKNGEGATLILYNIQFKVTQFWQPLKMFSNGAKLWRIENNIFLCIGQNLAVVPFRLDTEQLAALVGSHKLVSTDADEDVAIVQNMEVVEWEGRPKTAAFEVPDKLKKKIADFCRQGIPDSTMCELLIPDFVAENDTEGILNSLNYFYDFPENCIGKTLKYALSADSKHFKGTNKTDSNIQPSQRRFLVNQILGLAFNDVQLMPYLRRELDINDVITILRYIIHLLSEGECILPKLDSTKSENKLIDWGCLLLDANYQKIILSKDEEISEVLNKFNAIVKEHLRSLQAIDGIVWILESAVNGKPLRRTVYNTQTKYTVENINMY